MIIWKAMMDLHESSYCATWFQAKDKHGVCERVADKILLFAKNGHLRMKEFRSQPICTTNIYIYKYININIYIYIYSNHI